MQLLRTEAILLRRTNYGEADRILSMITPDDGIISAIAKGVRRPKSKLAGGIELLAVCDLTIAAGRGNMGIITSSRIKQFYGNILSQYERMQMGYDAIKQINRAAQTVGESDFYYLLRDTLTYLNNTAIDWRLAGLWFQLQLQALLGHALNTATDRDNKKLDQGQYYDFDLAENAFYSNQKGRFNSSHIKFLRLAGTKNPAVLQQVGGADAVLDDCMWLTRARSA